MHNYLKAAGFSEYNTEGIVYRLIRNMVERPEYLSARLDLGDGTVLLEYRMPVNTHVGICAAIVHGGGEFSEIQYYYPYFDAPEISTAAPCTLERHTLTETYSGIIEEYNIGLSLIFFMSNPVNYRLRQTVDNITEFRGTALSAFANEATVILPVISQDDPLNQLNKLNSLKPEPDETELLYEAAEEGDEDALETLTESDLNMLHQISERIESEDLYSLVEQSFMPCGVECDQYSVIGEILEIAEGTNTLTNEELWFINLSCNDVVFWMCMRKADLLGEPLKGRRLKARVWLTGRVNVDF